MTDKLFTTRIHSIYLPLTNDKVEITLREECFVTEGRWYWPTQRLVGATLTKIDVSRIEDRDGHSEVCRLISRLRRYGSFIALANHELLCNALTGRAKFVGGLQVGTILGYDESGYSIVRQVDENGCFTAETLTADDAMELMGDDDDIPCLDESLFVGNIDAYRCAICLNVCMNAVELPCGHFFGEECLSQLKSKECPTCREPFSSSHASACTRLAIGGLDVKCPCGAKMALQRMLEDHDCPKAPV